MSKSISISNGPIWAESVFHVLAHVELTHLAPSCHSRAYIAWAEENLGGPSSPLDAAQLREDVRIIEQGAASHDLLARLQALAFVFRSRASVEKVQDRELTALSEAEVDSFPALQAALSVGPPLVEVLRAAAELALPAIDSLALPVIDDDVMTAMNRVVVAAPMLPDYSIGLVRALGLRGRVLARSILVGVPGVAGADAEHVAWQAAHEATVNDVSMGAGAAASSWADSERRAIGLLRSRARAAGLGDSHARYLARFDLSTLGSIPDVEDPTK